MGKKMKGGRRQILQLEEKKPPKVSSKSKVKSLIHYSDSDDDSKKSNESECSPSGTTQNKDATPLESQIADFFKEIDALSVPDELLEEPDKALSSSKAEKVSEDTPEACSSNIAVDMPVMSCKDDSNSDVLNKKQYCPWQEICDSSTGYSYYWNVETNEVTWDCPLEYTAFINSVNVSTEKATHTAQSDKNIDSKEKKKKKNDIVVSEGAIIPISYFGNSSSSNDSSDSENELSCKKIKAEKMSEIKKNKMAKKLESRNKSIEEGSDLIGPSLPPDFQFPLIDSDTKETDAGMTVSENKLDELNSIGSLQPSKPLLDIMEKPSQSDLGEFPAEPATYESSEENLLKDIVKKGLLLNVNAGDEHQDSTIKKIENSLHCDAEKACDRTCNFRPVVEYDSFTDEDEEIFVDNMSSLKTSTDEKKCEIESVNQQEQENSTESSNLSKKNIVAENEISSFKRKASEALIKNIKKEELVKKPKRSNVNIDSLFASHSSYGKYGFGFGWQKQLDEQNDEFCTTNAQSYLTHKHQSELKTVSFVKSEDILDLKALNNEVTCETNHYLPDVSVQIDAESNQLNNLKDPEKPILNIELKEDDSTEKSNKISSDFDVGSSHMNKIKDKIDCSVLNKKKKNTISFYEAGSTSLKVEDDLDEIDKALCEALDAKKLDKNLLPKSSSVSDSSNSSKNMLGSASSAISVEKFKESESGDGNAMDVDAMTDEILEISSELIDKLTFLLSAPSTHASFSGIFFQLQTRFVDWQAGALNSKYFMARLKELEQYIQHYETGVISGEWTYQWDRESKRYFFINTRTQHSQWTFPEELCNQDKSSWVQSQAEAGPSSASNFAAEQDDLQTVSSSSAVDENSTHRRSSVSTFSLDSKDASCGTTWILQSSPPPPPPGVDLPPSSPEIPPPKSLSPPHRSPTPSHRSPTPPPPDTLKEPEDMDIENSNDSSSFLFVNNKRMVDDGRMQFLSMVEQSSKRSPISFTNASMFNVVSSTSMSSSEDLSTISKLSHCLDSSEVSNTQWAQPSCSSQVKIKCNAKNSASISTEAHVNFIEEKNSETPASSGNGVGSSSNDVMHLKHIKAGNVTKKEKKKAKIQPGLGLKKKNIPSLVEKWQKIKEQQDREDYDADD